MEKMADHLSIIHKLEQKGKWWGVPVRSFEEEDYRKFMQAFKDNAKK
jgi:hypothetical protein